MTTFITIAATETDPEAPLTSELAKKWADNPIAIGECDTTAPTNQAAWHGYNRIAAGSTGTGRIYNFGTDGAVANVVTPDYVDGYEYRIKIVGVQPASASGTLQIENYRETDGVYSPVHTFLSVASTQFINGVVELLDVRHSTRTHVFRATTNIITTNSVAAATTYDRVDFFSTTQKILRSRISIAGPLNINAGAIYLERRAYYGI